MAKEPIESLDQITPAWLTRVLSREAALEEGRVEAVQKQDLLKRELSTSARLRLAYAPGSTGERPARLFLKIVNTAYDDDDPLLATEVDYYTRDYRGVAGVPIARCFDAALSADGMRYHLLLADLAETHVEVRRKPLTLAHGLAFAEALAALHAPWWGAARLAEGDKPIHSPEEIARFVQMAQPGVEHILGCCGDELAPHWPQTLYDIYEHHPRLMVERARNGHGFTLIHGDLSPENILVPREADRPLYFIDRAPFEWSLTTWLGAYDLSYAMVTYWDAAVRRELEVPILQRYHAGLLERGVAGYAWDQLYEDYRLSAVMSVYVATEWCRGWANLETKRFWMPMLQKSLTACDDFACAALWR